MAKRNPDDPRNYQIPPNKIRSGDLRSSLTREKGNIRPGIKPEIEKLFKKHPELLKRIGALNSKNPGDGERILNLFWRLTEREGLDLNTALARLEEYVKELEELPPEKEF